MPTGEDELPVVYHENVLCIMVQAPDILFVYWDLSFGHIQALGGNHELILLLFQDNKLVHQIKLPPFTNNWYFRDVEPGSSYYCELGFQDAQGVFIPLLRSIRVDTPPLTIVEEKDWEADRAAGKGDAAPMFGEGKSYQAADLLREMAFYMGFSPEK